MKPRTVRSNFCLSVLLSVVCLKMNSRNRQRGKLARIDQKEGLRKDRPKKRKQSFNPKTPEKDQQSFVSSSEKN